MGSRRVPEKVKLIVGLIARDPGLFSAIKRPLEKTFSNTVDYESDIIDFDRTDYYEAEFGKELKRRFLGFKKMVALEDIYKTKIRTNILEKRFSQTYLH